MSDMCECGHPESRHFPFVEGDRRSGACMDCTCCFIRIGLPPSKKERAAIAEAREGTK